MEEWKIVCIFAVGHRDRYIGSLFRTSEPVPMIQKDGFSTVDFRYDTCGLWTTFRYQYPVRVVGNTENFHETTLVGHEKGMKRARKGHEKILEFIKNNPQISILALAKEFGITVKAMRLTLDKLKAEKRISRIGPNKGGYWQVMDIAVTE